MEHVTQAQFNEELSADGIVLVDFSAKWCAPCKLLEPVLLSLEEELDSVTFLKVDIDEEPELASLFDVMSVPRLLRFSDGVLTGVMGMGSRREILKFLDV